MDDRLKQYIEAGVVGNSVWIGAPSDHYDCLQSELTRRQTHILKFSIAEAEAVIKMLRSQVSRQKRKSKK